MSILPKQGQSPDPLVATPKAKTRRPRTGPPAAAPTLLTLTQFALVRKLKTAKGGFESECKRLNNTGRRTLAEWDELFDSYWNKPIR